MIHKLEVFHMVISSYVLGTLGVLCLSPNKQGQGSPPQQGQGCARGVTEKTVLQLQSVPRSEGGDLVACLT